MASRWAKLGIGVSMLLLSMLSVWSQGGWVDAQPLATTAATALTSAAGGSAALPQPAVEDPAGRHPAGPWLTPVAITVALPRLSGSAIDEAEFEAGVALLRAMWREWGQIHDTAVNFVELSPAESLEALNQASIQVVAAVPFSQQHQAHGLVHSVPYVAIRRPVYVRALGQPQPRLAIFSNDPQLSYYPDISARMADGMAVTLLTPDQISDYQLADFDRIVTMRPLALQAMLEAAGLDADYHYSEDGLRPLPLRALTTARNKALIQSFNRVVRQTNQQRLQQIWPQQRQLPTKLVMPLIAELLPSLSDGQEQFIADNPVIYYGNTTQGYPPYLINGPLDSQGFAVDLLDQLGYRLGLEFRPRLFATIADMQAEVGRGSIAMVPVTHSTNANPGLALSEPFDHQQLVLVVGNDNLLTPPTELLGQVEVVVRGSPAAEAPRPTANQLLVVDNLDQAYAMVNDGFAAFLRAEPVHASYMVNQGDFSNLALRPLPDGSKVLSSKRMLIDNRDPELLALVNAGLASISAGELQQLRTKWVLTAANSLLEQHDLRSLRHKVSIGVGLGVSLGLLLLLWQQLLLKRRRHLQWQIESALADARQARDEAQQQAQAKSLFMAKMSHEIRTPMNGVLGMAEALQATAMNDEQQELLATLNSSARNLLALLNDVLDYSKMEANQLVVEQIPFDLRTLCTTVSGNYHHHAASKGLALNLQLSPGEPLQFIGDPTRLTQVLNNLVSNALKFTHEGGVDISAAVVATTDDGRQQLELTVHDTGIGIPPERIDALFNPFTQADASTTRRYGGTGLGLTICRELVTAMGGSLTVASAPGLGSLFTLQLPLLPVTTPLSPASPVDANSINELRTRLGQGPALRVLVAEDNAVNLKVLTSQLRRLGLDATTAEDGAEALRLYQQQGCDLLLSDCHMPGMDGFALATAIRQQAAPGRPYLLALTADAQSGAAERCLQAGFDGYIAKPCPLPELARQLLQALTQLGWPSADEQQLAVPPLTDDRLDALLDAAPAAAVDLRAGAQPLLHRQQALALVGDDPQVMAAILESYLDHQQQDRDALAAAADSARLSAIAHRIKGSLRYLGAEAPAAIAAAIEQAVAARQDHQPLRQQLLEQLAQLALEVRRWLDLLLATTAGEPS